MKQTVFFILVIATGFCYTRWHNNFRGVNDPVAAVQAAPLTTPPQAGAPDAIKYADGDYELYIPLGETYSVSGIVLTAATGGDILSGVLSLAWGKNISSGAYKGVNASLLMPNRMTWQSGFSKSAYGFTAIITADETVRKKLADIVPGDQITLSGRRCISPFKILREPNPSCGKYFVSGTPLYLENESQITILKKASRVYLYGLWASVAGMAGMLLYALVNVLTLKKPD